MPPLAGALVAAALTSAIGATAASIVGALVSAALSFVAQALLRPPQVQPSQQAQSSAPTIDNKITVRQATAPRQIVYGETRGGGVYALVHTTDNNTWLHLVICCAGHEIEEFTEIWFNDEAVTLSGRTVVSGKFANKAHINKHLGASDQAADATLIAESAGAWSTSDRLRGIAYLYVRLDWDATVYAAGIPNITAVMKGKNDVYDPRDDSTGWSSNSALCVANYLCDTRYGVPVDYATGIDETALIAAANSCDENVTLAAGGTEKRYSTDGGLLSSSQPQEILGRLLGAMHGRAPYDGDRWRILAGVYQTPALTFTDDDLRQGTRKVQTLTSRRDLFNAVKGTFVGPDNNWQEADFPPVKSATYAAQDGQEIFKDIALPLTRSSSRAQRIAKIDLLRARQQIVAQFACKLTVWRAQAGDTVYWTSDRYGWTAKAFEIKRARFATDSQDKNPTLGVDLELIETAATDYDWSTDQESTVDPAPNTDFPNARDALPPSNLTATESLYSTRDGGGVKAKVRLAWDASPDAFVTSGGGYRVSYKLAADSDYIPVGTSPTLFCEILDVAAGLYDFRVEAINWAGNPSDPLDLQQSIAGLSAPPAAPVNFTVAALESFALARCTIPTELDVLQGGYVVFKHAAVTTGATWATALTLADPLPAASGAWSLPLKTGTYLLEIYDSSGIPSGSPASFVVDQASAHNFVALSGGLVTEDPGFAGTKTSVGVVGGELVLAGAGLISAIPLISGVRSIAYFGGVVESGTYDYATKMDLGSVKRHRLTNDVAARIFSALDRITLREGDVSTWARISSGVTGAEADSYLLVASTADDPAGAPTWTDWQRLDSATFNCRGHKFRRVLETRDSSANVAISADSVIAEGV